MRLEKDLGDEGGRRILGMRVGEDPGDEAREGPEDEAGENPGGEGRGREERSWGGGWGEDP